MNIETLATSKITESISLTDNLVPYLTEGDKGPSWDGYILIYRDKKKTKDGLGRVQVQIKGRVCGKCKDTMTYSVSTKDLNNYLDNGGVIFFVVYMSSQGDQTEIYYCELLPVKIRMLLKDKGNQKNRTIYLHPFPKESHKKENLFFSFFDNSVKQASFARAKLPSLEEIDEAGNLESVCIAPIGCDIDFTDLQKTLVENDVYCYAKIKGASVLQPIEMIPQSMHTSEFIYAPIRIGERQFYEGFTRIRTKGDLIIKIGTGIQINNIGKGKPRIHYQEPEALCDIVKDLDFIICFSTNRMFTIEGTQQQVTITDDGIDVLHIEYAKKLLEKYQKIEKAFKKLKMDTGIKINSLTQEDKNNIIGLVRSFVDEKPFVDKKQKIPAFAKMVVDNQEVVVAFRKEKEKDTYTILDFFDTTLNVQTKIERKKYSISQFSVLSKEDLLKAKNLNLDKVLDSYKVQTSPEVMFTYTNQMVLTLIAAYDLSNGVRTDLLGAAKELAERLKGWLKESVNQDTSEKEIVELNILQILKRERNLNKNECKRLCEMAESTQCSEEVKVGAYLLMGNQAGAEAHFERLSEEAKKEFMLYPIFKFWEEDKEKQ